MARALTENYGVPRYRPSIFYIVSGRGTIMRWGPSIRSVRSLLVAFGLLFSCAASLGQVSVFLNFAPPALAVCEQPTPTSRWQPGDPISSACIVLALRANPPA